jgi:hypothetical protein
MEKIDLLVIDKDHIQGIMSDGSMAIAVNEEGRYIVVYGADRYIGREVFVTDEDKDAYKLW